MKFNTIKIEYCPVLDLKPNSYNPNNHNITSFDLLIQSIKLFGFTQPIVAQAGTNIIIDGEHRWRVAAVLNLEEIPVVFLNLTEEQMKVATIIHNRARGQENNSLIDKIYLDLDSKGVDLNKDLMLNRRNELDIPND